MVKSLVSQRRAIKNQLIQSQARFLRQFFGIFVRAEQDLVGALIGQLLWSAPPPIL